MTGTAGDHTALQPWPPRVPSRGLRLRRIANIVTGIHGCPSLLPWYRPAQSAHRDRI